MYPPPPGSAPGYQELHHWTASGIINNAINASVSLKSGKIEILFITFSLESKDSIPPTSGKFTR